MPNPKLKLSEADIQKAIVDLLVLDGWRAIRTDPVSDKSRGKGFGEVGMPDYLFVRYCPKAHDIHRDGVDPQNPRAIGYWHRVIPCQSETLWIEFKAPGKEPTPAQSRWHAAERARGALVLVFDSIEGFSAWYRDSGLSRAVR
jgi:hypothetical protein